MAENMLSDLVHGIKGASDYIKDRRAMAAERRAQNSPDRLPMASSALMSTTVTRPAEKKLPGAEELIEVIETSVERTLQNPQGVIIKGQKRADLQFYYLSRSMKVVKDDTAYIRRKIDLLEKKVGSVVSGSGGGDSGGFFSSLLLRAFLKWAAVGALGLAGMTVKSLTKNFARWMFGKNPTGQSVTGRKPTGSGTKIKKISQNLLSKQPISSQEFKGKALTGQVNNRIMQPRLSLGTQTGGFRMNLGVQPTGFTSNPYNQRVSTSIKNFINKFKGVPLAGTSLVVILELIEPVYLQFISSDATQEEIDAAYIEAFDRIPGSIIGMILGTIAGGALGSFGGPLGTGLGIFAGGGIGATLGGLQGEKIASDFRAVFGASPGESLYYFIIGKDNAITRNMKRLKDLLWFGEEKGQKKPSKGRHNYRPQNRSTPKGNRVTIQPLSYAPVDTMTTGSINRNDPFTSLIRQPGSEVPIATIPYGPRGTGSSGPMFASASTAKGDRLGYVRPYEGVSSSGGRSRYSGGYDQNNPPGTDPSRMYTGGANTTPKTSRIRTLEERVAEKMSGGFNQNDSLADLIGRAEAGKAGYNAYNRGSAGEFDVPLRIEDMTIGQIQALQRLPKSDKNRILAVGKYQMIPSTLADAVNFMGLDPNQKFDRATQDKIYREYLLKHKRREVYNYITGKSDNRNKAINGMSSEWAALKNVAGKGSHDNVGGNRATVSAATVGSHLDRLREKYSKLAASGMDPDQAWTSTFGTSYGMDPSDRKLAVAAAKIEMENEKKARERTGSGGVAMKSGRLSQKQQEVAGIRKMPLDDKLVKVLNYAAAQAGIDEIIVNSGGQMTLAEAKAAGAKKIGDKWFLNGKAVRIGSTRHDGGKAADIKLRVGKKILSMNDPDDRPYIASFIKNAAKAGATGIGMGSSYMGNETMHVGFGNPAIWGKGRPDWIDQAYVSGRTESENFDLNAWEGTQTAFSEETADARSSAKDVGHKGIAALLKPKIKLPETAPIPTMLNRDPYEGMRGPRGPTAEWFKQQSVNADSLVPIPTPRPDRGILDPSVPIPTPRPERNVPIPTPRPDVDLTTPPLDPMMTQPADMKSGTAIPIPTPNPRKQAPEKSGCLESTYIRAMTKAKAAGGVPTYGSLMPLELFFDN